MLFETLNFNLQNITPLTAPEIKVDSTTQFILNGKNNEFFGQIKNLMMSPTNGGIIKAYVNYTIGEGLIDSGGINIGKYISKKDIRLICQDYKMYGQFSVKIVWSKGSKLLKELPTPTIIKWISTAKIGLNRNKLNEIDGYWWSYDWKNTSKYKPLLYPKFDGYFKDADEEILTVFRPDDAEFFPQPDYLSSSYWSQVEIELGKSAISHILNGFSAGKVVNLGGGAPQDDNLKSKYFDEVRDKLTGSTNNNKFFINYYDETSGAKMEIANIDNKGLDAQLVYFSEEAKRQIMASHAVTNPILFGVREGSGLGSNSQEMTEALKNLYRQNIKPIREEIIDSLEYILRYTEPNIQLKFKDFKELSVDDDTDQNDTAA